MKRHLLLFTSLSLLVFTQMGLGQTTYTWIGANGGSWATSTNWSPTRTTPATNDIIQFTGVSVTVLGVPSETIGQLNISADAVVLLSSDATLTINSSLTVNGSFDLNPLSLSGTGDFTLGATGTLKINHAEGISGMIALSGTKTFTDGASYYFYNTNTIHPFISSVVATNITSLVYITLNHDVSVTGIVSIYFPLTLGTNNLTLQSSATVVGLYGSLGSSGRFIDASGSGELRKVFSSIGSFTFPVGTSPTTYSPVTVNFTSGTFSSAYLGVKLVNSKHPNNTSATNFLNRYWTITQSGINSFSCVITATYVVGDVAGTEASIYCGAYNGSTWAQYSATNATSHLITATPITSFPKDFTGGETSVLPVELTSFIVLARCNKVELKWNTATEVKNYGFEIERSIRNVELRIRNWDKIGFVAGSGNSNSPKEYSFTDQTATSGSYSYRLKQIDNDGTSKYSDMVEVTVNQIPNDYSLNQNYPNPFNPSTTITYDIPKTSFVKISVYDILGEEIKLLVNAEKNPGHYEIIFDAKELAGGIYYYSIKAGAFSQSKKMILLK